MADLRVTQPPDAAFRAASASTRRRWFRVLLMCGFVAGGVAFLGVAGSMAGLLVFDPLTRHVGWAVIVTLLLLLSAALALPFAAGQRNVVHVLAVAGLGGAIPVVGLAVLWVGPTSESRLVSPDGQSILVVREGSDGGDPQWDVTVQESSPVVARTWFLACFNGDDPANDLAKVEWVSSDLVAARTASGQTFEVAVDPENAEPSTTIVVDCYE